MAEILAVGTRFLRVFAPGCARAVAPGAALQRAGRSDSTSSFISEDSRGKVRTVRSAACFAAVCGIAADSGATRTVAERDANAFGICSSREFGAACSGSAGIHAALRALPLWRRALRHHQARAIARAGSGGFARAASHLP